VRRIALVLLSCIGLTDRAIAAPSCTFQTVLTLPFGSYDPYSTTPIQVGGGSIQFKCTVNNLPVTIDLDMGLNSPAFGQRRLKWTSGSDYLSYNIYYDSAYTQIFGNGTGGTAHYSSSVSKNSVITVPYYGMLPAGQDATVGSYSDTVMVTMSF